MRTPSQTVPRSAFLLLSAWAVCLGTGLMLHECSQIQQLPRPLSTRVNPNTASVGELLTLPGVGPARAQAIVSYRESHFPPPAFESLEDLCHVYGLGPTLVRDMTPWLYLEEASLK